MNIVKSILLLIIFITFSSCADYKNQSLKNKSKKKYFSSLGFALIYEDYYYNEKTVSKKLNNSKSEIIHDFLRINTPIKIINPTNSKFVDAKVNKKGNYPKIFNVVITKEIAEILELNADNPYVEIIEVKKNKTFIAKKSNTFDEEKNVAEKAPVETIQMSDITKNKKDKKKTNKRNKDYILVISDFYYSDSAYNLMNELKSKIKINLISVKKINNNKYRLFAGPFKNFNALKTTYISLNNLGFENLNIYKE